MSLLRDWRLNSAWLVAIAIVASHARGQDDPATDAAPSDNGPEAAADDEPSIEVAVRLLDRDPFDRITLNAENGNAVIETVLLDLPERQVPDPLPKEGNLVLRRLSEPSIPYELSWSAIEKIELFEYTLLAEAERLTAAGEFAEAFEYLAFLSSNYPQLPGLEAARQSHLWKEASSAYAAGRRDEAWPILQALYLRNPKFPRLANAVQAVSDDIIGSHFEAGNYNAAKAVVASLQSSFAELGLSNIARWQQRFESDANAAMDKARAALAAGQYTEAREAVNYARAILPNVPGGEELWRQIQSTAPEIRVGVFQSAERIDPSSLPTWPTARVAGLIEPRLVEMIDFGAEGGEYESPWGKATTSDDGLETTLTLSDAALQKGLLPDVIALHLVETAAGEVDGFADFAAVLETVRVANGNEVILRWRRPPIKPEAFLQLPLRQLLAASAAAGERGLWFDPLESANPDKERRYRRAGAVAAEQGQAEFVVESAFDNEERALTALMSGDIDVMDRVPPWQVDRLRQAEGIVVGTYRLPTTHLLIPNPASPLLQIREFRRSLCYGIDSASIVRDILLAGKPQAGFTPLSGPFPAGASLTDPIAYAYNAQIQPRPFEPRLAALLAGTARKTLAKRDAEAKEKEQQASAEATGDGSEEQSNAPAGEDAEEGGDAEELAPPEPLVLVHSTDPIARLACQTIKLQLDGVGIPTRLAEFRGQAPPADMEFDLMYAEAAVWEPLTDARRLLGPAGLAGRTSPLMAMALDQLATSQNWNQALARLKEIHRIAHYDLPVIPLWQTVNYFAYRQSLQGVSEAPVSLYQNLPAWRKAFE